MIPLLLACWGDDEGHVHGHFGGGQAEAATVPSGAPFSVVEVGRVPNPTAIVEPAAGPRGLVVAQQKGRLFRLSETGTATQILDITDRVQGGGEMGLLGVAFHPKWPEDPRLFVNYTFKDRAGLHTRIASFRTPDGGITLDAASEVAVLTFDQPWSNHNSGPLAFGPDGMLYAAVGDGGSGGDPRGTGQRRDDLLGSILRLDIERPPYAIPPDNPFVGLPGVRGEIWAYGLRNPWGMHFDGPTLWWADVGQDAWEEVDKGVAGGNYGWNIREGNHCFEAIVCSSDFVAPVAEYSHEVGRSVTGGFVYRGPSIPRLDGKYIYGDFVTGRFFAVGTEGGEPDRLVESEIHPSTFGRDREGRMYIGDYGSGAILRVGGV
jgi:glucose/arabinose dehydrogenase